MRLNLAEISDFIGTISFTVTKPKKGRCTDADPFCTQLSMRHRTINVADKFCVIAKSRTRIVLLNSVFYPAIFGSIKRRPHFSK